MYRQSIAESNSPIGRAKPILAASPPNDSLPIPRPHPCRRSPAHFPSRRGDCGPPERSRRGGTENVPGIVGMGVAAELAANHLAEMPRVSALRDRLESSILQSIADTSVNG